MRRGNERVSRSIVTNTCTAMVIMLLMAVVVPPSMACPSSDDRRGGGGSGCSKCISNRLSINCPACVPTMRCMARCLWGGASRKKCLKKCDCDSDYPKLVDCKKCLSKCKCSCSSA